MLLKELVFLSKNEKRPSMHFRKLIFALAIFMTCSFGIAVPSDTASANTMKRVTGPGEEVRINTHMNFNKQCAPKPPRILVTREPKHGTVSVRRERSTVGRTNSGYEHCTGRRMRSTSVFYRANKGFTGRDSFRYRVLMNNGVERRMRARIAVGQ